MRVRVCLSMPVCMSLCVTGSVDVTEVYQCERGPLGLCASSTCVCLSVLLRACVLSCARLFNSMECSPQSPLSMGFSRQEYWSGLPFPPGDLPNPGVEPVSLTSPALQAGSLALAPPVLRSLHVCGGACGILPCVCVWVSYHMGV